MFLIGSIAVCILLLVPVLSQSSSEVWLECSKTCGGGVQCKKRHICPPIGSCCSEVYRECATQECPPQYAASRSSYQGSSNSYRNPIASSYQNQQYAGSRYPQLYKQPSSGGVYNYQQGSQGGRGYLASQRRDYVLPVQGVKGQLPLQRTYYGRSSVQSSNVGGLPAVLPQRNYGAGTGAQTRPAQQPKVLPLHRQGVGQRTGAEQERYPAQKPQAGVPESIPLLNSEPSQPPRTSRVFTRHDAYNARVKQCASFNDKPYGEMQETFEWVPCATSGAYRECELSCLAKNYKFCAPLARTVQDGTPCYSDLSKVCIDGKCQTPPDDCEFKDGRCLPRTAVTQRKQVVQGTFQPKNMKLGYNPVITIPIGSTNINITELVRSRNYLALKDHNGGKYYINGKWFIDSPQAFRCAGTLFTYKRPRTGNKGESLTASGPTEKALDVMLIYQKAKTEISYSYTLPVDFPRTPQLSADSSADSRPQYEWRETGYTPCSRTCAGGKQQTVLRCISVSDGEPTTDSNCPQEKPPIKEKVCNLQPCPASWAPQPWTQCSVSCGVGIQSRNVLCKQMTDRWGKPLEIIVPPVMCSDPRPPTSQQCKMIPCDQVHQWMPRPWSECNVSCDKGTQSRAVECVNRQTNTTVHDSLCSDKAKPAASQPCNAGSCKTMWFAEQTWTPCSFDCGEGLQGRKVFCATAEGRRVADERCDSTKKPAATKKCNLGSCQAIWLASPWGKCTVECGEGIQTRVVACVGLVGDSYQEFPETACPMASKPPKQQSCSRNDCKPQWYSTEWSECSQSCNGGLQSRLTVCRNLAEQGRDSCSSVDRPKSRRSCNTHPCPQPRKSLARDDRAEKKTSLPASCKDRKKRVYCSFVTNSGFCRYPYYMKICCASCAMQMPLSTHR